MVRPFFAELTRNPISLVGTAIATAGALLTISLFVIESLAQHPGPYTGILSFVVLPSIFVLGLLLIPVGVWRERRRERQAAVRGEHARGFPVLDLNRPRTRRNVIVFLALTAVNVVILATATYKGVELMDSTPFCGQTCHSVMDPEYTAYSRSPHARVNCTACHIGPGANWFVKSKLSGSWQLVSVTLDLYPRPIPTPVHNLRPARDTCEQCHWPTKFVGDKLRVITTHADDEASTPLKTVLLLRVGGIQGRTAQGIHWHVDPALQIRYRSDDSREKIYEVELRRPDGSVTSYRAPGTTADGATNGATQGATDGASDMWRVMDCVDCHNRPTHIYRLPEREVDEAIEAGRIPRTLPFVRRESIAALRHEYATQEEALAGIPVALAAFYRDNQPAVATGQAPAIAQAGQALAEIYRGNVFPSMRIGWGTYPNHLGHQDSPGCFRCHTGEFATADGQTISQDCSTCHTLLAMEEADPEVLRRLQP